MKWSCRIVAKDISEATAALHLPGLPTKNIIQFVHNCLASSMLTIMSFPFCKSTGI